MSVTSRFCVLALAALMALGSASAMADGVIGPLFGDTNGDGIVDMMDLNAVRNHFDWTGPADGTLGGDTVPFDGIVDIKDLNAVRNNFGMFLVPEPSTIVLALFGVMALLCGARGRRR